MDMQADDLRECLKELGWKQSDLARRLEITEATVSRWANGEPIPAYVAQYLGLVRDVGRLHRQYVAPPEKPRAATRAEASSRAKQMAGHVADMQQRGLLEGGGGEPQQ